MTAERVLALAAGGLAGGYLVGSLPVAWILVRRRSGLGPRGRGRGGAVATMIGGGLRTLVAVLVLELIKGAVVGIGARTYSDTPWFTVTAIAGCVAGDAFPAVARGGRRGVVPLASGAIAAVPGAWLAGLVVALPVVLFFAVRGAVFETTVGLAVPGGFLLATRDWSTLPPALLIVVVLVARSRLRRRDRARAAAEWRRLRGRPGPDVIDVPAGPSRTMPHP